MYEFVILLDIINLQAKGDAYLKKENIIKRSAQKKKNKRIQKVFPTLCQHR